MLEQAFKSQLMFSTLPFMCAGLLPPAPGSGMVMLQMTAPPCQQPRAPSPCQRKQPNHKYSGPEHHRSRRPVELQLPLDNTQVQTLPYAPATPFRGLACICNHLKPSLRDSISFLASGWEEDSSNIPKSLRFNLICQVIFPLLDNIERVRKLRKQFKGNLV